MNSHCHDGGGIKIQFCFASFLAVTHAELVMVVISGLGDEDGDSSERKRAKTNKQKTGHLTIYCVHIK